MDTSRMKNERPTEVGAYIYTMPHWKTVALVSVYETMAGLAVELSRGYMPMRVTWVRVPVDPLYLFKG